MIGIKMTTQITAISENAEPSAGQPETLYTVPVGAASATVNIRAVSLNLSNPVKIQIGICASGHAANTAQNSVENIQPPNTILGQGGYACGMIEDCGIIMAPGESIVVTSDTGSAAFRVHGFLKTET